MDIQQTFFHFSLMKSVYQLLLYVLTTGMKDLTFRTFHFTLLVLIDFCPVCSESINLEFSLIKLLIFYQKSLQNIRSRLRALKTLYFYFCIFLKKYKNRLKVFLQRIPQEIMKKNNNWNIRRLVDDSFVPSAQRPSVNLS